MSAESWNDDELRARTHICGRRTLTGKCFAPATWFTDEAGHDWLCEDHAHEFLVGGLHAEEIGS